MADTQVRIDKRVVEIVKRFARKQSRSDMSKKTIKDTIGYLVRTHPEIAQKPVGKIDDKEV